MSFKYSTLLLSVFFLSSCELLPLQSIKSVEQEQHAVSLKMYEAKSGPFCLAILEPDDEVVNHNCNMDYWLYYWSEIEKKSWPQRKAEIENLGSDTESVAKKILLSQGKGTPYKDRFRAQNWLESLLPKLSPEMRNFMLVSIYQLSQELLEMESALVTLSRTNASLSNQNEQQKLLINKQKSQIDQLLKIEASIINSSNGDN